MGWVLRKLCVRSNPVLLTSNQFGNGQGEERGGELGAAGEGSLAPKQICVPRTSGSEGSQWGGGRTIWEGRYTRYLKISQSPAEEGGSRVSHLPQALDPHTPGNLARPRFGVYSPSTFIPLPLVIVKGSFEPQVLEPRDGREASALPLATTNVQHNGGQWGSSSAERCRALAGLSYTRYQATSDPAGFLSPLYR